MSGLSEDDSSDSSNEFLVDPEKINLNSSFFAEKKPKVKNARIESDTENESSDEDLEDVTQTSNIELFTQVLQNLENSQKFEQSNGNVEEEQSVATTSQKGRKKESEPKKETIRTAISNEINELLLQGENHANPPSRKNLKEEVKDEENEEENEEATTEEYSIPKEGIKITLPGTSLTLNRKKKGSQDLKALIRRRLRANQILIEKVGLLCWLAYGFYLNREGNEPEVMATSLSLLSTSNYPKDRIDLTYLEKFTKWFKNIFTFKTVESNGMKRIDKETLLKVIQEKEVSDYRELVLLYIATLRALGLNCRLVVSLCPPHKALSDNPFFKIDKKESDKSKSKSSGSKRKNTSKSTKKETSDKTIIQNSPEAKKNANIEAKKRAAEILQLKSQSKAKKSKLDTNKNSEPGDSSSKSTDKIIDKTVKETNNLSGLRQLRSRKVKTNSTDTKTEKPTDSSKSDDTKSKYYIEEDSTDSEAEFHPKPQRVIKKKSNTNEEEAQSSKSKKKYNRKLLSSDSEDEEPNKLNKSQDIWAEVYLESEESWICASVMDEKIHCVNEVYKKAKKPVLYVVAWNSESLIKDVTRRYCSNWLTVTRKQRIDEKWWLETLSYWKEKNTAISRAEDEMLLQKDLEQPLPKTIGECKGHPLYVIARHLLKFEALYPPDCVPLGHLPTGEAIYSRHCVHTCCSRETWLKKAKVVKPNQEPYKIVKARPKYDKLSGMKIKDSALEVFGEWQTMDYEPPEAKDGIVPRNEYGNVDLFKQCMLPKGTVHINLPGLNRIARKLNIDCAPAVVGFNFGCMGAVPALEGYVVCSEYEDTLREAWEAEQVEAVKRAKEKREKRVYGNWKRLIQGLIIRQRLAAKYEFSEEIKSVPANKRAKHKKTDTKKTKVS
ncbi:DNA repair protein complementing XP-C cells homolog [Calliopsis andreniformis]|uniref:DNA repair protein complementing XP-C cells homolog n=1 Tax=Calliopsis andreniformis TaxID=337506 RepID=UPI003FCC9C66